MPSLARGSWRLLPAWSVVSARQPARRAAVSSSRLTEPSRGASLGANAASRGPPRACASSSQCGARAVCGRRCNHGCARTRASERSFDRARRGHPDVSDASDLPVVSDASDLPDVSDTSGRAGRDLRVRTRPDAPVTPEPRCLRLGQALYRGARRTDARLHAGCSRNREAIRWAPWARRLAHRRAAG
jgi:hypothetical protein